MRTLLLTTFLIILSVPLILANNDGKVSIKKQNNYICILHFHSYETDNTKSSNIIVNVLPPQDMSKIYQVTCEVINDLPNLYDKVCYIYTNMWHDLPLSKQCKPLYPS